MSKESYLEKKNKIKNNCNINPINSLEKNLRYIIKTRIYSFSQIFFEFTFIFVYLISFSSSKKIKYNRIRHLNSFYSTYIKILTNGTQTIFGGYKKDYKPDLVYLNGKIVSMDSNGRIIISNKQENNITLVYNNKVSNCRSMFYDVREAVEIDLTNFDTSSVTDMGYMFGSCYKLEKINFGKKFKTSLVENMEYMFRSLLVITSIDLSSFDTSRVTDFSYMFSANYYLSSLNLSTFKTQRAENMRNMFFQCKEIISLNLSSFDTSSVSRMESMFEKCLSLISLNLSNFHTSFVTNMANMFSNDESLINIDLSSFNISNAQSLENMFKGCISLISLNLSSFQFIKSSSMENMFSNCISLISLDLSSFLISSTNGNYMFSGCSSLISLKFPDSNKLAFYSMSNMFYGCNSLISLNLSNFDTRKVTNMDSLFYDCSSLAYLDLSNLNISSVKYMNYSFFGCSSLKSLNLPSIDSFNLINIKYIFSGCSSLTSLSFPYLNTTLVDDFSYIFSNCKNLISLDLSMLNTSSIKNMQFMLSNCNKLTYINFTNFDTTLVTNMQSMFMNCKSISSLNISMFKTETVKNMKSMFSNCEQLSSLDLSLFSTDLVNNIGEMFYGCNNLEYINFYNLNDKLFFNFKDVFYGTPYNLIVCIKNESKATKILPELSYKTCSKIDCSKDWKQYLNKKIIVELDKCIDNCSLDEIYQYEFDNKCYTECPVGTNSSKENKFLCEPSLILEEPEECPLKYPFFIIGNNTCSKNCEVKDFFNKICKINSNENQNEIIVEFITKIIKEISNGNLNELILNEIINKKEDIIIEDKNTKYQITSTFNQNNKKYDNVSTVILGECENTLKDENDINEDDTLIMLKLDHYIEGLYIPIIEYIVFDPYSNKLLDLSQCQKNNNSINYYIPLSINPDNLYIHDPSSDYYINNCNIHHNEKGVDMTIYERKNEYNNKGLSLCQSNCIMVEYIFEKEKVNCECQIQTNLNLDSYNNKIDKYKLLNKFINLKKIMNIDIMTCYKVMLTREGLIQNIGSYILLSILFIFLVSAALFYFKGYDEIKEKIKIVSGRQFRKINERSSFEKNQNNIIKKKKVQNENSKKLKNKFDIKNNLSFSNSNIKLEVKNSLENVDEINNDISKKIKEKKNKLNLSLFYVEREINLFTYEEAMKKDKRSFKEYYFSLIKLKQLLIFSFYPTFDYNSMIIKISLFFFSFALYYTVNGLFFNDSTMHKIYEDNGIYNLIYSIPQLLYSIIISSIISSIVKRLSISEKNILEITKEKNITNLNNKIISIKRCLLTKFIFFFTFSILFLILFWYYLSCFCAIYRNTQIYLITDTLISFSISLLYPFILCLIPAILRIAALNDPRKCLYKTSRFIQFL